MTTSAARGAYGGLGRSPASWARREVAEAEVEQQCANDQAHSAGSARRVGWHVQGRRGSTSPPPRSVGASRGHPRRRADVELDGGARARVAARSSGQPRSTRLRPPGRVLALSRRLIGSPARATSRGRSRADLDQEPGRQRGRAVVVGGDDQLGALQRDLGELDQQRLGAVARVRRTAGEACSLVGGQLLDQPAAERLGEEVEQVAVLGRGAASGASPLSTASRPYAVPDGLDVGAERGRVRGRSGVPCASTCRVVLVERRRRRSAARRRACARSAAWRTAPRSSAACDHRWSGRCGEVVEIHGWMPLPAAQRASRRGRLQVHVDQPVDQRGGHRPGERVVGGPVAPGPPRSWWAVSWRAACG